MDQSIQDDAKKFITNYLSELRHKSSLIPPSDRGHFPFYWWKAYKISMMIAKDSLAINLDRPLKGKFDTIGSKNIFHTVEIHIFNNLDYSLPPLFPIKGKMISISHMTLVTDRSPFVILHNNADVRIFDVRFEQKKKTDGYPMEKTFLWMFSNPTYENFSLDNAQSIAKSDFYGYLNWLLFFKWKLDFKGKSLSPTTISYLRETLEDLIQRYTNLITRQDLDEEMLQQFIEQHYLILTPNKTPEIKKRKVGPYIPDFVLQYEDNTSTLVELQLNTDLLFEGGNASRGLEEAVKQMREWFSWIADHEYAELARTDGLILIGRRDSLEKYAKETEAVIHSIGHKVKLLTYDDLLDSMKLLLNSL